MLKEIPMRPIKTHPEKSIRFTCHAQMWCNILNTYKRFHPSHSFKQMAQVFNLSETSARRYFYGIHHFNGGWTGISYSQVRKGAAVTL